MYIYRSFAATTTYLKNHNYRENEFECSELLQFRDDAIIVSDTTATVRRIFELYLYVSSGKKYMEQLFLPYR